MPRTGGAGQRRRQNPQTDWISVMPEYLAPGVFVEEVSRGPRPVEGVETSTTAMIGETERGPLRPPLITSYREYLRVFGDVFAEDRFVPFSVKAFFDNGGQRCVVCRVVGDGAETAYIDAAGYRLSASGPGQYGNAIWVRILPSSAQKRGADGPVPIGFRLQVAYFGHGFSGDLFDPFDDSKRKPRPVLVEDFDNLSLDTNSDDFWRKKLSDNPSALITLYLSDQADIPAGLVFSGALKGGQEGKRPTAAQFAGRTDAAGAVITDPANYRGLAALERDAYQSVAIVHAPGIGNDTLPEIAIQDEVIAHCERNRFRFAVLDTPRGVKDLRSDALSPRNRRASDYAAIYYPWIVAAHPKTGDKVLVPPGGAVCGVYARVDSARGVWKAPAGVAIKGAVEVEFNLNANQQDVLNQASVNCIRQFPGRGICVWGARTLSSGPEWKYVPVRRFFIFLEASISRSLQWVVFEPNDEKLWSSVAQAVGNFLSTQWRAGALAGAKESEAYFVSVGRDTMTEADIANGRLVMLIGVAALRPAEFVIIRISLKTSDALD